MNHIQNSSTCLQVTAPANTAALRVGWEGRTTFCSKFCEHFAENLQKTCASAAQFLALRNFSRFRGSSDEKVFQVRSSYAFQKFSVEKQGSNRSTFTQNFGNIAEVLVRGTSSPIQKQDHPRQGGLLFASKLTQVVSMKKNQLAHKTQLLMMILSSIVLLLSLFSIRNGGEVAFNLFGLLLFKLKIPIHTSLLVLV